MSFKFEKLKVWQMAMDLGEQINALIGGFPDKERFILSSQLLRATDSIALNISEGSIRQSDLEQKKFIGYPMRSLAEVITCLYKAKRRNYIDEVQFEKLYLEFFHLMKMLVAFRNNIK
jgi:four helix bundle protein